MSNELENIQILVTNGKPYIAIEKLENLLENSKSIEEFPPFYFIFLLSLYLKHAKSKAHDYERMLLSRYSTEKKVIVKIYIKTEQYDKALSILDNAYEIQPNEHSLLLSYAQIYSSLKNHSLALNYYNNYLNFFPDDILVNIKRAKVYAEIFDWQQEEKIIKELTSEFPDEILIQLYCANRMIKNNMLDNARIILTNLKSRKPNHSKVDDELIHLLLVEGKYDYIIKEIPRLSRDFKTVPKLSLLYARALFQCKSKLEAFEFCKEAISLNPTNLDVNCFYLRQLIKSKQRPEIIKQAFKKAELLGFGNNSQFCVLKARWLAQSDLEQGIIYLESKLDGNATSKLLVTELSKLYEQNMQYADSIKIIIDFNDKISQLRRNTAHE